MASPKKFKNSRRSHLETKSVIIAKFRNLLEEVLIRELSWILLLLIVGVILVGCGEEQENAVKEEKENAGVAIIIRN